MLHDCQHETVTTLLDLRRAPCLGLLGACRLPALMGTTGQQPDEEALLRPVPGCVGYLAGVEPVSRCARAGHEFASHQPNGTGIDNIDVRRSSTEHCRDASRGGERRGVADGRSVCSRSCPEHLPFDRAGRPEHGNVTKVARSGRRTLGLVGVEDRTAGGPHGDRLRTGAGAFTRVRTRSGRRR